MVWQKNEFMQFFLALGCTVKSVFVQTNRWLHILVSKARQQIKSADQSPYACCFFSFIVSLYYENNPDGKFSYFTFFFFW